MLKLKQENKRKDIARENVMDYMRVNKHFINFVNKKPQQITTKDIKKYINYISRNYPQKLEKVIPALSHFYGGLGA